MSKILKDAALIVGVAAIAVVSAGALAAPGSALAGSLAAAASTVGLSSAAALGTALSLGAAALTVVSGLVAKKPSPIANPMAWTADPQAGIPYVMGRYYVGGQIVYRTAYGKDDVNETIVTVLSAGPIQSVDTLYVDGVATSISGTTVNITDRGKMFASYQMGAQPETRQLGDLGPPNWTINSKLSGLAATSVTFVYDAKGKVTFVTEPQVGWLVHGVKVYDPRLDSTYPGGNGAQRSSDETTWAYSENPYLHALTWLLGRRQNGKKMLGVGVAIASILVSQFVEGANVADTNGWKITGSLSSTDDTWSRLKDMLQAGGGEPIRLGAQIGCIVNTPRVSLATITVDDVIGDASVQATQAQRDRINAIVPRYTAELDLITEKSDGSGLQTSVTWAAVSGSPVIVQDYVTFDGKQRQKEVSYTFVGGTNGLTQSQQLARYDIENSREFGPITLSMKLRWMGYKPGDVVTAVLPELGLNGQDILLLNRELSPADGTVTMTARSETAAKHAFALGQTGTAPATPSVTGPALVSTPGNAAWALAGGTITSASGTTIPVLQLVGEADTTAIDAIVIQYRTSQTDAAAAGAWVDYGPQAPSLELLNITGVQDGTDYDVSVAYQKSGNIGTALILGPATAGQTAVPYQSGVVGPKPPVDADNTGSAWQTATGSTIEQTTTTISQLVVDVSQLQQSGGSDDGAAASAQAAADARDAAQAAQSNAQTAASQAQDSYTAADGARADAVAAEQSAAASSGTAASSSAIAASSASAATLAMAQTFPSAFTNLDAFTRDYTTPPASAASIALTGCYIDPNVSGYATLVLQQPSTISPKGWMTLEAGHTYRATLHYGVFGGADTANGALGYLAYASDGTYLGPFAYVPLDNANGGFKPLATIDTTTEAAQAAFPSAAYLRPYVQTDMPAGSGSLVGLNTLSFRDVVDLIAAQDAAQAAVGSASNAAASDSGAAQQAAAATAQATNASTFAGQAQSYASQASSSSSSAAGSANSAASSAGVAAAAGTSAQGVADSLYPAITPSSITSFTGYPPEDSVAGPSAGWPTPYLLTNSDGAITNLRHKLNHPRVAGRRYRVTLWVYTYSEFTRVALYAAQAQTIDGTGAFENGDSGAQVDGWNWGDLHNIPTQQFYPMGIDYVSNGADPFWNIILYVNPQETGTPGNALYHIGGFNFSDVTDSYAAQGSASAAASSASSAAASNDAAGQHASAAQQSATDAATQYGNATQQAQNSQYYAGQSATSASQASTSDSNAAGSANTASSYAQQAASSQSAAGQSAGAAATSASTAQGAANSAGASASSASSYANDAYNYSQSSQSAANSSSSSSATASAAAAAAQQNATLSASISLAALNINPVFSVWPAGAQLPTGYGFWGNSDNTAQTSGYAGRPYAVQQNPNSGEELGFYQSGIARSRGWYVIEADVRIYGSFVGAGVLFNNGDGSGGLSVNFGTDPDVNGVIRTASENPYWIYSWRKLVQSGSEDYGALLYAMTGWTGFGDLSATRSINWDRVVLRKATDGEVAGQRADGNANAALAQISSLSSTTASADSALSSRIDSVNSSVGSVSASVSSLSATVTNVSNRVNTAVFQVIAQAGTSEAILQLTADGYGKSAINLAAGAFHVWSQDGSTLIEAISVDNTGLVTIPNLAVGQINTQHIVGNAVTTLTAGSISGTSGLGNGQTDQSGNFTVATSGAPVKIDVQQTVTKIGATTGKFSAMLYRDGQALVQSSVSTPTSGEPVTNSFFWVDNPGAGSHNYYLIWACSTGSGSGTYSTTGVQLCSQEAKR